MHPDNSPFHVRAWYEDQLAAAAHQRLAATQVELVPHASVWRKLVAWLTA